MKKIFMICFPSICCNKDRAPIYCAIKFSMMTRYNIMTASFKSEFCLTPTALPFLGS